MLTGCILHANFLTNCAGIVVDANELKKLILFLHSLFDQS